MRKDIPIATFRFKGPAAVVVTIAVAIGGFLYNSHRRESLHTQSREQIENYLATELVARKFRQRGKSVGAKELLRQKKFEIVELTTPFIPGDRPRVRVVVRTPDEELEYHFRFRRVFGEWKLQGESHGGLFR